MTTIDVAKEMQEAYDSYLQDEWDRWLVEAWMKYNSVYMPKSVNIFCYKHGISSEKFFSLKRTPKIGHHLKCAVTRYVAAYLPLLNTMLWDGKKSVDEIVKIMKVIDTQMNPSDSKKVIQEHYEFTKTAKEAMAENYARSLVRDQREANGRSNWKVCK